MTNLNEIAKQMVAEGKGILAADESSGTIKKRFDTINVNSSEENRMNYRRILFESSEAMENYISGVILFDETIRQSNNDGERLVDIIKKSGSLPGIKVDMGAKTRNASLSVQAVAESERKSGGVVSGDPEEIRL